MPFLAPLLLPPLVRVSVGKEEGRHSRSPGLFLDPGRLFGESPGRRQELNEMHPQSQVGAACKCLAFGMDNPTVCKSQNLYDRLIQAALDSQGAACKGSSMHESMMHAKIHLTFLPREN